MEFKTYRITEDYNFDEVFSFIPLGSSEKEYLTQITVDGLDMDLEECSNIVRVSCTCEDYKRRRHICKHIQKCLGILGEDIKFRLEEPLKRYWCSICKDSCDTHEEEPKCYKCKKKMLESDSQTHGGKS